MGTLESLRALVVDDEPAVRQLTVRALAAFHFQCDEAADGDEAAGLADGRIYDVVVTDLRMPRRNGHSLAVDLVGRERDRPLVVVLTGVLEPRLAADLIARGIDDIEFKPVDFRLFGAKVRALCDRRRRAASNSQLTQNAANEARSPGTTLVPIPVDVMEKQLDALAGKMPVLPISDAWASFTKSGCWSLSEITRRLCGDPLLLAEVMRRANGGDRGAGKRAEKIDEAVVLLGDGEIRDAAMNAPRLGHMSASTLPWMDIETVGRRCMAAGFIATQLNPEACPGGDDEGLYLASLLLPASRIVMGLAFPELYRQLVEHCQPAGCSLASLERNALPASPARALACLLARWNLSTRVYKVLQHSGEPYSELATLAEPLRSKVELVRVAELLASLVCGRLEAWEEIEFPLPQTMSRLRVDDVDRLVEDAKAELAASPQARSDRPSKSAVIAGRTDTPMNYYKLGAEPHDFVSAWLRSQGFEVVRVSREVACQAQPVLLNCLDVSEERMQWFLDDAIPCAARPLVCNAPLPRHFRSSGMVAQLPCSYRTLQNVIAGAI